MVLLIIIPIKWLSIAIPAAQSHATLLRLSNPPRRILRELRQGGADLGPALRGALHLPRPASGVGGMEHGDKTVDFGHPKSRWIVENGDL